MSTIPVVHFVIRSKRVLAIAAVLALTCPTGLSAHRVIGRTYPTLATAFVQSPTASPRDLPIPIFDTGVSVICFRVTNTSPAAARITALGLELPGQRTGFALLGARGGLTLVENVAGVPGFPDVTLDFALMPEGGLDRSTAGVGLAPGAPVTTFCVSGPFDPAVPIETLLNGVFVRFEAGAALGNVTDVGAWERR